MIRRFISNNLVIKYYIKGLQRKKYINKMEAMSLEELMNYDAELFEKRHGTPLDWNNLQTYSEKMQWEKIFDHNPLKATLSDKYLVREWIGRQIGDEYLIPLIGVWKNPDDIDFSSLPNQFVLKTNCSSGDVIIVRDKKSLSKKQIRGYKAKLKYYLHMKFGYNTCELHYNDIEPRIIAEAFIDSGKKDLQDYKFICFDGKAYYCWVDSDRFHGHKRDVYDMDWNLQDWHQYSYSHSEIPVEKPDNFERMKELAERLAQGFSHVRVDLYNVDGKIYFGEMTFTNSSGFEKIEPIDADYMLGKLWKVDTRINNVE